MTKFAVHKESFQFNTRKYKTAEDAYYAYDDHNDEVVGLFDTIEEARECLADIRVDSGIYLGSHNAWANVAWIEESDWDYDEDLGEWEFVMGSDIWDFKYEPLPTDEEEDEE